PGTLVALAGNVGLEQSVAIVLGQARSVVDHLDVYPIAVAAHDGLAAAAPPRLLVRPVDKSLDRLLRVLHQVGDRLRNEAPVAADNDRLLADFGFEYHVGTGHLAIEHAAFHQFADIVILHFRFGRAREGGKLVDHARDVADLTYDGVGAALEHIPILGNALAVFAPDALGG